MRLTNANRLELARFGCAFLPSENLICIGWEKGCEGQLGSANVATRLFCPQVTSGPLLCLGFEISATRILAHYCWYPFDAANSRHRKYLSKILEKGTIRLSFIVNSRRVTRIHEISSRQR